MTKMKKNDVPLTTKQNKWYFLYTK